jgi:putative SOS response-associated peptidase YedK
MRAAPGTLCRLYRSFPDGRPLQSDRPFGLAGPWERWEKHGAPVESRTILTTDANGLMQPIHGRMPVVVPPDQYGLWLDPRCQDTTKLAKLLRPYPAKDMLAYRVSALVNDARNDVPPCAEATW